MALIEFNLDPVDHITVDALGKPGNRVFYIQGRKDAEVVSLIIEKIQLQSLTLGIPDFFEEIQKRFPDLAPAPEVDLQEEQMRMQPPVDPKFRVGNLGLAYDDDRDLVCIIARELQYSEPQEEKDEEEGEEEDEEEGGIVRYWCTRQQLAALSRWGVIVTESGRPICPQCQQPMEPEGHFCPKKNGHKRPTSG